MPDPRREQVVFLQVNKGSNSKFWKSWLKTRRWSISFFFAPRLGSFFLLCPKAWAYTDLPRIGTRSCGALDKTITFLWKDAFENDPSGMNVGTWRLVVQLWTSLSEVCAVTALLGQSPNTVASFWFWPKTIHKPNHMPKNNTWGINVCCWYEEEELLMTLVSKINFASTC